MSRTVRTPGLLTQAGPERGRVEMGLRSGDHLTWGIMLELPATSQTALTPTREHAPSARVDRMGPGTS